MPAEFAPLTAVAVMALVTLGTRLGGLWLMRFVPLTPRVEAFLRHLSASVLVALVLPVALAGGAAAWLAVGVAGGLAARRTPVLPAMLAGVAAAALWRAAAG